MRAAGRRDYGIPAFHTLNAEFRRRVTEEAASGADLVITFVWGMDTPEEAGYLERLVAP